MSETICYCPNRGDNYHASGAPGCAHAGSPAIAADSETGAGVLRRAAALMRERANAARDSAPEIYDDEGGSLGRQGWYHPHALSSRRVASEADSEHIASWAPAAALGVADWLERTAEAWEEFEGTARGWRARLDHEALTVARTYLGEQE